ncbi:acyloxyacyl hydrolase isoform X1 [Phascolarctos cinereus]|uniref:Acyloxyacyl hydrolase isoform X1 n=2 Tax=Phascolarctos cinereus TaxID=38626 RepID=A0A6P5IMG6_PHACI|nr:acyloxyacyl hydrolase isoform X1 [Phascolarctos cinereus]
MHAYMHVHSSCPGMKSSRQILLVASLLFLFCCPIWSSSAPRNPTGPLLSDGHVCIGCVLIVSIVEQLAQVHNSTTREEMERLCSYLPEKLFLKSICYLTAEIFGPDIIKLLSLKMNADVVCHALHFCKQKAGQPVCHLYKPPQEGLNRALSRARKTVRHSPALTSPGGMKGICSIPALAKICQKIEYVLSTTLPFEDTDGDKFSIFPTLRGFYWRGRDCNDRNRNIYPGRRPENWDAQQDSNCNGIWGIDPKDGIPYEKKFCEGSEAKGLIVLGDSAAAHFHIPPEWLTAEHMSVKTFSNLPMALSNELDLPQLSGTTGFWNSTSRFLDHSIYLRLRQRNRCNHRDYQNISKNGASSKNLLKFMGSLSRNRLLDHPAIVIYTMLGNDVCNGNIDTVSKMTTPQDMQAHVMETLTFLNLHLPPGSYVVLYGLADGRFLWDQLHDRYHPLGQLNRDITYEQLYAFLSCVQVNPCQGWMSSNETLRTLTSERAKQLSNVLEMIAASEKFANISLLYLDYPFKEMSEEWQRRGGETWQLIELADGFHPSEVASQLAAQFFWEKVLKQWPQVLGKENPFNDQIEHRFGDQGGH